MSERPVITAQLIVASASRRCALITVAAANNAAMIQKISLSGTTTPSRGTAKIRPHKAAKVFEERNSPPPRRGRTPLLKKLRAREIDLAQIRFVTFLGRLAAIEGTQLFRKCRKRLKQTVH
jgi:hypothetical protein